MIPHFSQPRISLGPLTIHAFGVLVACAVIIGMRIVRRRAADQGISEQAVGRFLGWVLIGGFAGAHLVDRIVYFPAETVADPLSLFRFWESLSSFGGFLGGTVGALLFFRRHAARSSVWKYVDSFTYAFPFGWILGRMGCFIAYDHPGRPTRFFLGQMYKDGVVRHNLGLYEAIYSVGIAILFYFSDVDLAFQDSSWGSSWSSTRHSGSRRIFSESSTSAIWGSPRGSTAASRSL